MANITEIPNQLPHHVQFMILCSDSAQKLYALLHDMESHIKSIKYLHILNHIF